MILSLARYDPEPLLTPGRTCPCPPFRTKDGGAQIHANDPGGKANAPRHGTQSGRPWRTQKTAGRPRSSGRMMRMPSLAIGGG